MKNDLKHRTLMALADARRAIDPSTNGLLDRKDCEQTIADLCGIVHSLLGALEQHDREPRQSRPASSYADASFNEPALNAMLPTMVSA
jgi:hypothetical protein